MQNLNSTATRIYQYIRQQITEGVPPSVREICNALGIKSTSTVHRYLKILEKNGYIDRVHGTNRNIKVAESQRTSSVPVLGAVTAGVPIFAEEHIEGYIAVSSVQFDTDAKNLFGLRVIGDSMIGAGIEENDVIVVDKAAYIQNGDIVVALLEDEATVKRFYREQDGIRLQPENPAYQPLLVREVEILGKVKALVRYL